MRSDRSPRFVDHYVARATKTVTVARSSHPREVKSCRGSWRKGSALRTQACVHRPDYALYPHRCRACGLLLGTIPLIKIPVLDAVKLFIVLLVVSFDRRYIAFTRIPPARAMESPLMCWLLTLNLAIVKSSSIIPIPIPESSRSVSCCSCDDGCDIGCGMKKA